MVGIDVAREPCPYSGHLPATLQQVLSFLKNPFPGVPDCGLGQSVVFDQGTYFEPEQGLLLENVTVWLGFRVALTVEESGLGLQGLVPDSTHI